MLLISLLYTYKNLLLHAALSLLISLLLIFLNLPVRLLEGLHTYVLPENPPTGGARAAIRRPSATDSSPNLEEHKNKKKNRSKFEFDEGNAQIFRLQLIDDYLRSRLYFSDYRDVLVLSSVAFSNFLLHHYISVDDNSESWENGSWIPIVVGLLAVCRAAFSIARVTFERSASKRSEKQLSFIFGVLGFTLVFFIISGGSSSVIDFKFDSIDGFGKIWVALFAGCLAGFLFMPSVKSAKSFWLGTDQLRWNLSIIPCGSFGRVLLYANFIAVVFTASLWITPLFEIFINQKNVDTSNKRIRFNENLIGNVGIDQSDFEKFRVWSLMGSGILQFMTLRPNVQMFMNEAVLSWYQRLHASKVPDLDFSRAKIFLHNYYVCLAVLQFVAPWALVLLFLGLSRIEGNFLEAFPFVCSFVPCSAFVKEVALFMSWWIAFVWSIFSTLTLVVYRCGFLYVS